MRMDENEFFRQATLRICGNLEIEEAMSSCLQFLQQSMPVDRMYLQLYDPGFSAMRSIATATASECSKLDLLTPLSKEARADIRRPRQREPASPDVALFENPEAYAISREMLQFHGIKGTSLLVMLLESNGRPLGSLVLVAEGVEGFTAEHARLLYLLKEPFVVAMSNAVKHREVAQLRDMLVDDNRYLHGELRQMSGGEIIIGANFGLRDVMQMVRQVAALDSPVLLLGETGAGKDMIANAIHYSSTRRNAPFISVNCGAIPETLIDSELFGHEKGAFTGALSQKRGRFERADKGTIFLDEIGELPPPAQVRLLKVLQSKEIERVGGANTISLDIRIIAATNRNLEAMVKAKRFREDLWFRLNVFPIWIPPLRERKSDIPALVQHFVDMKTRELKLPVIPTLASGAIDQLMEYHWPGNVRELQNVVERALILNPDGPLAFDHLNLSRPVEDFRISEQDGEPAKLDDVVSRHIQRVLAIADDKIHGPGGAAELLGVNPSTLRNRMNKLGIEYGRRSKN